MNKLNLARLNTPIQKLERLSKKYGKGIFVKRDDFTGLEASGNKIRKLEYSLEEALRLGFNCIITMGGIQSNHVRACATACAQLGLECHLVLRGDFKEFEGNLFLDALLGAHIHVISPSMSREEKAEELRSELEKQGKKPLIIPVGASNAQGSLGYIGCYNEISAFEAESGISFDYICLAVGSGGTYAGLWFANNINTNKKHILGFAVCDDSETFKNDISKIANDMGAKNIDRNSIEINDKYIGRGYALASPEEIAVYKHVAGLEGLALDPCYTGKAFLGMLNEIENGELKDAKNILFIHTGGLMGWTKEHRSLLFEQVKDSIKFYSDK